MAKSVPGFVLVGTLMLSSTAGAERLYDKEVARLLDQVSRDLNRFVKAVDKKYRTAKIRSASGEVDVGAFLDTFTSNCAGIAKRMTGDYAASAEAKRCLVDAAQVQRRVDAGRDLFGAEGEWQKLVPSLERLAATYGIEWGSDFAQWESRRYSDGEIRSMVKSASDNLEGFVKPFQQDAKKNKNLDAAVRKHALDEIKGMEQLLGDIDQGVRKQAPVGHLITRLQSEVEALGEDIAKYGLSGQTLGAWRDVVLRVKELAKASQA